MLTPGPRSEHLPPEPPPSPAIAISASPAAASLDASAVAVPTTSASAKRVVDFALPKGCDQIYDPTDACTTLRSLIDVHTRLENRACLSRIQHVIPGYGAACEWATFSYKPPRGGYTRTATPTASTARAFSARSSTISIRTTALRTTARPRRPCELAFRIGASSRPRRRGLTSTVRSRFQGGRRRGWQARIARPGLSLHRGASQRRRALAVLRTLGSLH
jgi:hypothetical protein